MDSKAFRSLQESAYNVVAGIKEDTTSEDLFIEYLEGVFGADNLINESVDDEDIAGALLRVLELAEAIEYVIERDRSVKGLSSKMYNAANDEDQAWGKAAKRAPKIADAAHKVAKKKYGKLAGDAMRRRAERQAGEDEYGTGNAASRKNKKKIEKLGRFIARRTGKNPGDGRGD